MLVMTVGLPGSGKSTLIEELDLSESYIVISADRVRAELFRVVFDPKVESQVWKVVDALVEGHLQLGRSVVLDTTNLSRERRQPWLEYARRLGHDTVAIFLDVSFEEVLRRNCLRTGDWVVPEDVLVQKRASLEPPTLEEGFNKIVTVGGASTYDIDKVRQALVSMDGAARDSLSRQVLVP